MELCDVLEGIPYEIIQYGKKPVDVAGITIDSRKAREGFMFICISGLNADGHKFIEEAASLGATVAVCEHGDCDYPADITVVSVTSTRETLNSLAGNFYDHAVNRMRVIGVTGTNGKTSTTHFLESILAECGVNPGVIGTSGARTLTAGVASAVNIPYATSTTPDTIELHAIFAEMAKRGTEYVAMEVSSHALALQKVGEVKFALGIFTNLTQDHLDFHVNMQNYLEAKARLFSLCAVGLINADAEQSAAEYIKNNAAAKIKTFAIDNEADFKAENLTLSPTGISFELSLDEKKVKFALNIPGRFSAYNALAAVSAAITLGFPPDKVAAGLAKVENVPGRIQPIENSRGFNVFVDYAHSPDGLKNIINAVKEFTKGRVITVFGCGGNRDPIKRPIMGKICGELSDFCVITSDNPRNEVPERIIEAAEVGIKQTDCEYIKITDRREAIFKAIGLAKKGDSVIIAGKGHEDYQEFENNRRVRFDDAETAKEALICAE
ncbi:UDP-N-acetylmuramoyl-L-alanyl-D-glutamate--2,6-diaminopimelate ligase [Clostridia bacterium]|nr:UDP-N-acetylmuramoyl-L-alanyl-D-glutamate--2,6-diaminopimelate ligase [Clostridia bacterium]